VLFRSLRSLAGRTLAAGAASAVALTLFNAAQPSLGDGPAGKPRPGTLETVKVALTPVRGPAGGSAAGSAGGRPRVRPGLWTAGRVSLPVRLRSPSGGPSPGPGR
jgi:hypothetical protein